MTGLPLTDSPRAPGQEARLLQVSGLIDQEKYDEAAAAASEYLASSAMDPVGIFLLGQSFLGAHKPQLAMPLFAFLSMTHKRRYQVWVNLGKCYDDLSLHLDAQRCYRAALALNADSMQAWLNLSSSLVQIHDFEGAKEALAKYREFAPGADGRRQAAVNEAFVLLHERRYDQGWTLLEEGLGHTRWRNERHYGLGETRYQGEPQGDVIVFGEQGVGDQVAYAQAVPGLIADLKARGRRVVMDVHPKLRGIFARSFAAEVHGDQFETELDWLDPLEGEVTHRCSLVSLARFYRAAREDFTGDPYLVPDPVRVRAARAALGPGGPNIGLAWSGGIDQTQRKERSIPFDLLAPLLRLPARFVSLEYRKDAPVPDGVIDLPWLTQTDDMDDLAALLACLDMVVAVPTTAAHLAGAVGTPVWCILHDTPHFLFAGPSPWSSDWYGSMRLFPRAGRSKEEQVLEVVNALTNIISTGD